jgi:hypothetical protein
MIIRTPHRRPTVLLIVALGWQVSPDCVRSEVAPVGAHFQVNTYTTSSQGGPAVSSASDGSFVVVWSSYGQDDSGGSVQGQRFDASGAREGTEFQVNTYTIDAQESPAVSWTANASFVVVWQSFGQDGSDRSVQGQRFAAGGTPEGTEFQVNTYTTDEQRFPAVASTEDGSFVVVWQSYGRDGNGLSIQGQRFAASGAREGTEFQVNTYTTYYQYRPAISSAADGSFIVVWHSYGPDGARFSIQGQRFDASGAREGSEFQVNTYTTEEQRFPAIASAEDGSFVVVWESWAQDDSGWSIQGQRFAANGAREGTEFQVNTYTTSNQTFCSVSSAADGSFVVAWQSYGQDGSRFSTSIQGQRFAANGAPDGTEFRVDTFTTSDQGASAVSTAADGSFVVVWHGWGDDGDESGVQGQRFVLGGEPTTTTTTVPLERVCGDPIALSSGAVAAGEGWAVTATDALFVVQAAVNLVSCELCVCDVDGSSTVTATDALVVLRLVVGLTAELLCPPCD